MIDDAFQPFSALARCLLHLHGRRHQVADVVRRVRSEGQPGSADHLDIADPLAWPAWASQLRDLACPLRPANPAPPMDDGRIRNQEEVADWMDRTLVRTALVLAGSNADKYQKSTAWETITATIAVLQWFSELSIGHLEAVAGFDAAVARLSLSGTQLVAGPWETIFDVLHHGFHGPAKANWSTHQEELTKHVEGVRQQLRQALDQMPTEGDGQTIRLVIATALEVAELDRTNFWDCPWMFPVPFACLAELIEVVKDPQAFFEQQAASVVVAPASSPSAGPLPGTAGAVAVPTSAAVADVAPMKGKGAKKKGKSYGLDPATWRRGSIKRAVLLTILTTPNERPVDLGGFVTLIRRHHRGLRDDQQDSVRHYLGTLNAYLVERGCPPIRIDGGQICPDQRALKIIEFCLKGR